MMSLRHGALILCASMLTAGCALPWTADWILPSGSMEPDLKEGARLWFAAVSSVEDIATTVEGGDLAWGKPGDILQYFPANDRNSFRITHRAIAYVDVRPEVAERPYWIRWGASDCETNATLAVEGTTRWCVYPSTGISLSAAPHAPSSSAPGPYKPSASGFLTKGDNPYTNVYTDQSSGLSRDKAGQVVPVPLEWIGGKLTRAR